MTTKPISMREPASGRYVTQDQAGALRTLGDARTGWPISVVRVGAGTTADALAWDAEPALILDLGVSVGNAAAALAGGTVRIDVYAAGQAAYSGTDGWIAAVATLSWIAGQAPFVASGLLGKAVILTGIPTSPASRLRIVVTGADPVQLMGYAAPISTNPAC